MVGKRIIIGALACALNSSSLLSEACPGQQVLSLQTKLRYSQIELAPAEAPARHWQVDATHLISIGRCSMDLVEEGEPTETQHPLPSKPPRPA